MNTSQLIYPKNYFPLHTLSICSNKLIGGGNIIGFDNFPPILIGKGTTPLIWIYAKDKGENWIPVISENKSIHPAVIVSQNFQSREIIAKVDNVTIIHARMTDDNSCLVNQIDLRPLGLNLFGNEKALTIGTSSFSGNIFQGANFMIGVKDK